MTHPGVEAIAGFLADSGFTQGTIPEQRAAMDQVASASRPPDGVTVEPGRLGGRDAEWLETAGATDDGGGPLPPRWWLLHRFAGHPPATGRSDRSGFAGAGW